MLLKSPDGEINFSYSRQGTILSPFNSGGIFVPGFDDFEGIEEILSLFKHSSALIVLHEFMGFVPYNVTENASNFSFVEEKMLTFARLDVYIARTVFCLRDDCNDNVGGHRQKL